MTARARVMIAEDEESIIASLEFVMRKSGHEVCVVRNGADAIDQLPKFRPHLLLLDVMLPGKTGIEVCRAIRGMREFSEVRIIMLTAKGTRADAVRGAEAGADEYIIKPFSTRDLVAGVDRLLGEIMRNAKDGAVQ